MQNPVITPQEWKLPVPMILCSNSLKQINFQVAETLSKSIQSGATTEDILDYIKLVGSKKPETVIYT